MRIKKPKMFLDGQCPWFLPFNHLILTLSPTTILFLLSQQKALIFPKAGAKDGCRGLLALGPRNGKNFKKHNENA